MGAYTKNCRGDISESGHYCCVTDESRESGVRTYERTDRKRARPRKGEWADENGVVWAPMGSLAGSPAWQFFKSVVKIVFCALVWVGSLALRVCFFLLRIMFWAASCMF